MMSRKKEKPTSDIDNVENMLQALGKVPGQIKDDSTIEISTEEQAKTTSDMTKIKLQELQVTIQLRKWWSILLLVLVGLIIISDGVITYLTGLGILNFTGISLPLFIGSNLAQIFALSVIIVIIVKFLFNTNTN
jgi:hypothetical protein cdivTM_07084